MEFYCFDTPFGPMALGEEGGAIVRLYLPNSPTPRLMSAPPPFWRRGSGSWGNTSPESGNALTCLWI